ncbi:hypothetical protein [Candidatus Nitronereus thalassa]|uniref:Uncharacterized protein n=1 Tax=Candidatus Nitronereus thalassa TaxID=3020898 RepID=A0ABU3K6T2_9BACT|nr:hypothetical protein [Candidatus Nitronereus thalassa]MDT7042132.1 hypothetical protein [Candidatus Nitronereus thalassa]
MNTTSRSTRPLTYDEKKAAEAAFRGSAFDPSWSEGALKIYEGLRLAMARRKQQGAAEFDVSRN